ncbi:hypothetical protein [Rhodoluna limnophila]|uniref:hypothetical protein n=1 Tax=Rhodoluna limnophila TaxID=232537 RepID=UPI00156299DC|nr:hypothetical protein [Rhodoluna limnophila]
MDLQVLWDALLALVPPVAVGGIFWIMMRGILRADSKERQVYQEMEAEIRAEREAKQGK